MAEHRYSPTCPTCEGAWCEEAWQQYKDSLEDDSYEEVHKKEKELDRAYDYADAYGFSNAAANVGFVKRRARRRLRHNEKKQLIEEVVEYEVQSN